MLNNLAKCLLEADKLEEAETLHVHASLEGLARAELQLGNLDRAHRLAMQSIDEFKRTRRENHPDFAGALGTLGSVLAARGDALGSTSAFAEALAIAQTTRPPAELQVAHLRRELGMAHAKMNRLDHAKELLIASLNDLRRLRGDKALDTIVAARSVVQFLSTNCDNDHVRLSGRVVHATRGCCTYPCIRRNAQAITSLTSAALQ